MLGVIKLILILIVGACISVALIYIGSLVIMWLLGAGAVVMLIGLTLIIASCLWDVLTGKKPPPPTRGE